MLALNNPVIDHGSFYVSRASAHGEVAVLHATESGASIAPDALIRAIKEIDDLGAEGVSSGDKPTRLAQTTAKRLLLRAHAKRPIYVVPTAVEASDGDLLIHWDAVIRSVVLICPAFASKPAQIYTEALDGKRAIDSGIGEATPQALSDALAWVLRAK